MNQRVIRDTRDEVPFIFLWNRRTDKFLFQSSSTRKVRLRDKVITLSRDMVITALTYSRALFTFHFRIALFVRAM